MDGMDGWMDERTQPTDDGSAVIWSVEAVRYYSSKQKPLTNNTLT
jgi:hypothetical protein